MAGNVSFAVAALLVCVVGLSVYTYLPIRAHFYPPINEGEPTNWNALWAVLTRQQYGKPSIFDNPTQPPGAGNVGHTAALYWAQLVNYAQYFSWQFAHDWSDAYNACWRWCSRSWAAPARCAIGARTSAPPSP